MGDTAAADADMTPLNYQKKARVRTHQGVTESWSSASMFLELAENDKCAQLDAVLYKAIVDGGWPEWETPGRGGYEPYKQIHLFQWNSFDVSARIDFYRGLPEDDWMNLEWAQLLGRLPSYRSMLHSKPIAVVTMGNATEMAVSIANTCCTRQHHLPDSHNLVFDDDHGAELWARAWPLFKGSALVQPRLKPGQHRLGHGVAHQTGVAAARQHHRLPDTIASLAFFGSCLGLQRRSSSFF